jgi:hypothetical protein
MTGCHANEPQLSAPADPSEATTQTIISTTVPKWRKYLIFVEGKEITKKSLKSVDICPLRRNLALLDHFKPEPL